MKLDILLTYGELEWKLKLFEKKIKDKTHKYKRLLNIVTLN